MARRSRPLRGYTVFSNRVDPADAGAPFEVWETCVPDGQASGCWMDRWCECRREASGALKAYIRSFDRLDEAVEAVERMNAPLWDEAVCVGRLSDQPTLPFDPDDVPY